MSEYINKLLVISGIEKRMNFWSHTISDIRNLNELFVSNIE